MNDFSRSMSTKKAKTNEHQLCQQFVEKRLREIQLQFDQCTYELIQHSETCPSTLLPLVTLDSRLKEFIQLQQQYLSNKFKNKLLRFKDHIHEKELLERFSIYHLSNDQVNF